MRRLRSMGREELAFRARAAARIQLGRLRFAAGRPRWHRTDLSRVLAPYVLDAAMREAIGRRDWMSAHRAIEQAIRSRPPRFVIDPSTAPGLRAAILQRWPAAADDARARADRIVAGEYDLLGYRALDVTGRGGAIDWHFDPTSGRRAPRNFWADVPYLDPGIGDHKVVWELNRHQHWLALGRALWLTGDGKYGREILVQLRSWLADNPPSTGINWASMLELAFRCLSWTAAMHLLLADGDATDDAAATTGGAGSDGERNGAWLVDMLVGLHHQLEHVVNNLSAYFSPNTHLLGEALALYVVGQSLPELSRSARWTDVGRRILLEQIDRQIEADGGHAERSLHYHRYTHDFYLLALLVAERAGDEEAAAMFREAADRLATFLLELADDNGRTPLIGDDDGGMLWPIAGRDSADVRDSLALAAVVLQRPELAAWGACEEAMWLTWSTRHDRPGDGEGRRLRDDAEARLTTFPQTGYAVARSRAGDHLVFDAGPHGYLNCGHAHADALAVTLAIARRPLLVDPGTACYTVDPTLRDRMRRTANHNTLCVGGRSSSEPAGAFHWRSRADGRLEAAIANGGFGWVEGSHDGYAPFRHRRSIVHADGGWLFVDELLGTGDADAHLHWHFHPEWTVALESERTLAARYDDRSRAWLVHDAGAPLLVRGDDSMGLGWYSPKYGALVPTWTARMSISGPLPLSMITWVGAGVPGESAPRMERVRPDSSPGEHAAAVRLRRDAGWTLAMLRPGGAAGEAGGCRIAGYHTNARMLHFTVREGGALESVAVARCTRLLALEQPLLSVTSDVPVDLYMRIREDRLVIHASDPPPQLRIEGRPIDGIRGVRLNGREHRIERTIGAPLVVSGADWPAGVRDTGVDLCVA